MYKYVLNILFIVTFCVSINAQKSNIKIKVVSNLVNEPLIGATIYFKELKKGANTNFEGITEVMNIPKGNYNVSISFIGYQTINTMIKTPTDHLLTFKLEEISNELETVVIQTTRSTRTIKRIPTRLEFIGAEELEEKAIMNPSNISMVLRESTGIQMQQTSLSSGNMNIRIQGLEGRYTQLLRDGFPLYGGFSSGLSILQIPPLDLEQFEIIKGSSSTLYGGGAIAGLVNMVSKKPEFTPSLDLMFTQTQAKGSTANIFYSKRGEKVGLTVYGSGHYQNAFDPEGDHFSNLPETHSVSLNPKLFYYPSEKTNISFGLNGTYDNRIGGDINKINNGKNGIHQYTEENISKRLSSQFIYETQLDSLSYFQIKNSFSFFERKLSILDFQFKGKQRNSFTEITYNKLFNRGHWTFGANLYTSDFNEDKKSQLIRDQNDLTYGTFVNNIYDLSRHLILESGLRIDYTDDFGFFPLPKVALLYKNKMFSSRIGGGLGYKIPNIFTEEAENINFQNIVSINKKLIKPEYSYGVNLDVNFNKNISDKLTISINQLFYLSSIKNGLLLNDLNNGFFNFENAKGKITSRGAETNLKFSYESFRWFLNYAFIDTQLNYLPGNPQKPLTAKHSAGSVLMYESKKWRIGYETYYFGRQFLSDRTKTKDFITMGLLLMRNFKFGSLFANFENFTDQRQSNFSPLVLPPHEKPKFPEIYAPTDGFIFSLGIIIKPFGNNHED